MTEPVLETPLTLKPSPLTTVTPFSKALALILFIALPFVGFYLGTSYQGEKLQVPQPIVVHRQANPESTPSSGYSQSESTISAVSPSIAATDQWKTYINEKHKFSLKYPSNWKFLEVPDSIYDSPGEGVWFTSSSSDWPPEGVELNLPLIISFSAKSDVDKDFSLEFYRSFLMESVKIGNRIGKKYISEHQGFGYRTWAEVPLNDETYAVFHTSSTDDLGTSLDIRKSFDQILSTLKFQP